MVVDMNQNEMAKCSSSSSSSSSRLELNWVEMGEGQRHTLQTPELLLLRMPRAEQNPECESAEIYCCHHSKIPFYAYQKANGTHTRQKPCTADNEEATEPTDYPIVVIDVLLCNRRSTTEPSFHFFHRIGDGCNHMGVFWTDPFPKR